MINKEIARLHKIIEKLRFEIAQRPIDLISGGGSELPDRYYVKQGQAIASVGEGTYTATGIKGGADLSTTVEEMIDESGNPLYGELTYPDGYGRVYLLGDLSPRYVYNPHGSPVLEDSVVTADATIGTVYTTARGVKIYQVGLV